MIDNVQKYWDDRPCNIRHSKKPIGSMDYFDEVEQKKYFVEPHIKKFAYFDKWRGKKVLEIGCGIGTDSISFARVGADVVAVDYSTMSTKITNIRAKTYGLPLTIYQANAEELSKTVPVEEYDLIYSFGVIHHTPHPEKVIEEIKKYMGPKSVLKIMVYNRNSWKVAMMKLRHPFTSLDKLIPKYSEAQTGCPITYSYTKKSVRKLLDGLYIIDMCVDHIFPYQIKPYQDNIYKKKWYFAIMPKPLFRFMEQRLGWHLCVTACLPLF